MLVSLWWTDVVRLQPLILEEQLVCHCKYIYTWKQPLIKSGYFNIVTFKVTVDDKLLTKQPSCLLHDHQSLFSKKCSSWFKCSSVSLDSCWVFTSLSRGILSLFILLPAEPLLWLATDYINPTTFTPYLPTIHSITASLCLFSTVHVNNALQNPTSPHADWQSVTMFHACRHNVL